MSKNKANKNFIEAIERGGTPASAFMQEVGGTSRIFGRNSEITVAFEGDQAYTDGSRIVYPAIDSQAIMSDEEVRIARGYVDHEAGHIQHTDFDFSRPKMEHCVRTENWLLKDMLNAVEDIRLEREVIKDYRGARKNLSAVGNAVTSCYFEEYENDKSIAEKPEVITPVAFTWAGRLDMQYDDECLRNALKKWVRELDNCKSTSDSWDLARRIVHDIEENDIEDEDYENQPTGKGIGEDDSNDGQGQDDGQGSGNQDGMTDAQMQLAREEAENKSKDPNDPNSKPMPFDPNLDQFINNFVNDAEPSWGSYRRMSSDFDIVHRASDPKTKVSERASRWRGDRGNAGHTIMNEDRSPSEYQKLLSEASGPMNVMKRKLERAIQSKMRVDWDGGREYGRLDSRRLASAYQAKPNVFRDKEEAPFLDTAVSILVDHSGSMSGSRARVARDVTICLAESLNKIGASFEICGWNNHSSFRTKAEELRHRDIMIKARQNNVHFDQYSPLHLYLYKSYEENHQRVKDVLVTMPNCVTGYNCDGDALNFAGQRLLQRKEKRKVFLVLSDGQPAGDADMGKDKTYLRNTVGRFEAKGIDLIGIGIQSTAVKSYYPKWVVCNDLDDLGKHTIDMLAKALLGERFVVDNSELLAMKG
jgi:cobalamin biosynthesis protein CobT